MSGEKPPPQVYKLEGKIAVTADVLKQQATDIMKKIDNFSTKIKNQRATRNEMLQKIYGAIASMNLTYDNREKVEPKNEAELVTAIAFLKTNDSTDKAELQGLYKAITDSELDGAEKVDSLETLSAFFKDTKTTITDSQGENTAIYETIKKSELPEAKEVEVGNQGSIAKFISATEGELKNNGELLTSANKTIDGCQTHFNEIENKLSDMGEIVDPGADLPAKEISESTPPVVEKEEVSQSAYIIRLNNLCDGVLQGKHQGFGGMNFGIKFTWENRFKSLVEERTTTNDEGKKEKEIYIKEKELGELLNIKLLLMYLKVAPTFGGSSEVDKYLSAVNKQLETIISLGFYKKNSDAIEKLLVKLTGVSSDGTIPENVPQLDFLNMCVVLFYLKDTVGMMKQDFRPLGTAEGIQKHLNKCLIDYQKDAAYQLSTHLSTEDNISKLEKSGTITTKSGAEKDIEDSTKFIDRMLSSKKSGGKTMKKRRNLNKGGKTIRKMLKRTLKRGGNFRKKLTKRK